MTKSKITFSELVQKGKQFVEENPELVNKGMEILRGIVNKAQQPSKGLNEETTDDSPEENIDVPATYEVQNGEIVEADSAEGDHYFEDMMGTLSSAAAEGIKSPEAAMQALGVLADAAQETIKYVAEQETKRVEIVAKRDAAIAKINAVSNLIKEYLDKTFDERKAIFTKQFECVDAALQAGNTEMLAVSLNSINELAASSPFKQLADIASVQKGLESADTEWDI